MPLLSWYRLVANYGGKSGMKTGNEVKSGKKKSCKGQTGSSLIEYNLFKLGVLIVALVPLTLFLFNGQQATTQKSTSGSHVFIENETFVYEERAYNFLATVDQHYSEISLHEVECHPKGYKMEAELGLDPQRCGTMVTDELMDKNDLVELRKMAIRLIDKLGDTTFRNRESINLKWINLHNVFRKGPQAKVFREKDFQLINKAAERARNAASIAFGLPEEYIWFHGVCQFTRYKPVVPYHEFRHVDKLRSPNLVVTSILWLSTVDEDFGGGRTEFLTGPGPEPHTPLLVEPKMGRFAAWTSSYENPHGVNEVLWGQRYALIFAFTVLQDIGHPNMTSFREWATTTDTLK